MRAAVLTVSTTLAQGEGDDRSGDRLVALATEAGAEVVAHDVVADDRGAIADRLRGYVADDCTLAFTTGGTGLTPDDVTPEATRDVIDRDAPGFAEAMRQVAREHTPMGILSRGVSGIAGGCLIVNFPGNPKAIDECWPVIGPTLRHATGTLRRVGGRAGGGGHPHG